LRYRYTLGAALLFVALLVWVLARERGRAPQEGELFKLDVKQVTRLEVTPQGGEPMALEKRGDQWWIASPFEGWADKDEAERVARTLCELKPDKRPDEDPTRAQYGLDKPVLTARLWYDGNKKVEIALGAETPVGSQLFARIEGRKGLFLVSSVVKTDLSKKPEDLRDKKLAHYEKDDVEAVALQNARGTFEVKSRLVDGKKEWDLVQPVQTKADRWSVDTLVNRPGEIEVKGFEKKPDKLAQFGLDKPSAKLTLHLASAKTVTILLGAKAKKTVKQQYGEGAEEQDIVYAMTEGRPELLMVEASLADDLDKDLMALRDKRILAVDREKIRGLRVQRKKGLDFYVAKRAGEWFVDLPRPGKAKQTKVDDLLWNLEDLQTSEFIEKPEGIKQYGLAVPQVVVTIETTDAGTTKVLFGDRTEDSRFYCKVEDRDTVYVVSDLFVTSLPEKAEDIEAGQE